MVVVVVMCINSSDSGYCFWGAAGSQKVKVLEESRITKCIRGLDGMVEYGLSTLQLWVPAL